MSTNSWHVFATHTVAETWCQKILCHLCQWHCAGWSMAGCSRLCNPFPRHRRCRCARTAQHNCDPLANKHAVPRRWPNRSWQLMRTSPINEDLTLASEVQISRYDMLDIFARFLDRKNTKIKKVQKQHMRLKFSSPMANLHLVHYRIWQG